MTSHLETCSLSLNLPFYVSLSVSFFLLSLFFSRWSKSGTEKNIWCKLVNKKKCNFGLPVNRNWMCYETPRAQRSGRLPPPPAQETDWNTKRPQTAVSLVSLCSYFASLPGLFASFWNHCISFWWFCVSSWSFFSLKSNCFFCGMFCRWRPVSYCAVCAWPDLFTPCILFVYVIQ